MLDRTIMSKRGKKKIHVQRYQCDKGHIFHTHRTSLWEDSFIEVVVYTYLRYLSLNTTIDIMRMFYEDDILTKGLVLDFIEIVTNALPTIDDIDNLYDPVRSGYLAFDGVWFHFAGEQIVLLVCFDPVLKCTPVSRPNFNRNKSILFNKSKRPPLFNL